MVTKFVLKENKTNSCRHALFYKQRFFQCFFQPHCCLTFSWTKLQILLRCCLNTYLTIILLRHIFYLVYLYPCLGLGLFMSYLCDLFFIFRLIFITIFVGLAHKELIINRRICFVYSFRIFPIIFAWYCDEESK